MRVSTNFALTAVPVLFGLLLVPGAALAAAADCPVEPAAGVPIASGDVFAGPNCVLSTPGDVDSFRFSANSGDFYRIVAAMASGGYPQNVCLQLLDPSANSIFSGCSNSLAGVVSIGTGQTLATTGFYTIVITEAVSGALSYGTSLERLHPVPLDAQQLTLGQPFSGMITPLTDSPAFTAAGLTTGIYRASATLTGSGYPTNLCISVYFNDGTSPSPGSWCTNSLAGVVTVQTPNLAPPENGPFLVLAYEEGENLTADYTLTVSCLAGSCGKFPPCTLKDTATYNATSSTLTMNFTIGNNFAATWNAWLIYQNATPVPLFSVRQPKTVPPAAVTKTYATLSPEGNVGVLSTLTTPTTGVTCSSWVLAETGAP